MNLKFLSALSALATFLLVGCAAPVQYVQTGTQVMKICDPVCRYVTVTPAQPATTTVVTTASAQAVPAVVYVQQPLYVSPIFGIATGYLVWRSLGGYGGHHRR